MAEWSHPQDPESFKRLMNEILQRLRDVERIYFHQDIPDAPPSPEDMFRWQGPDAVVTGYGKYLFAHKNGRIVYIRAERGPGDGTTDAVLDVEKNDVSITADLRGTLGVPAGEQIGPEIGFSTSYETMSNRSARFQKGDRFRVNVIETGGGTGPLTVTIHFIDEPVDHFDTESLNV